MGTLPGRFLKRIDLDDFHFAPPSPILKDGQLIFSMLAGITDPIP